MGDSLGTLVTDFQGDQNRWGKFFWRRGDSPGLLGTSLLLPGQCILRLVGESSLPKALGRVSQFVEKGKNLS